MQQSLPVVRSYRLQRSHVAPYPGTGNENLRVPHRRGISLQRIEVCDVVEDNQAPVAVGLQAVTDLQRDTRRHPAARHTRA